MRTRLVDQALGLLETDALAPAMVAVDVMLKSAEVEVLQIELNDLGGVSVQVGGATAAVQTAVASGNRAAQALMPHRPITSIITRVAEAAGPGIRSRPEFNPLIQQAVVFAPASKSPTSDPQPASAEGESSAPFPMNESAPQALGFLETQGFTAVLEALDTACKAANVTVVGKEKLGGGYVTVVLQGELSAVAAAIEAGRLKVDGLGKLIAAHVIARPCEAVLSLLPRL
jgi:microcompartment protein CcmL/EutN